jgi:hypothetical protein
MKKLFAALLGITLSGVAAVAQPNVAPDSLEAMGCMKLGECTEDVIRITDVSQFVTNHGHFWPDDDIEEIQQIIEGLTEIGVEVYVGHDDYFPPNHRGLYYTDVDKMFLNAWHMRDSIALIEVLRHEAWHAVQDCMAGTIDNSLIAIVFNDKVIPSNIKVLTEARYGMIARNAIPWEQEAFYAATIPNMTVKALDACSAGNMWSVYPPTPMTREWLVKNNYIK